MKNRLVKPKEFAYQNGLEVQHVYYLIRTAQVLAVRVGRVWRILPS
jgi:hypothetical protein